MKLRINCMQCFREDGQPSEEFRSVEMTDDGKYSSTCKKGHTTVSYLQQHKFEILFEMGAMAHLDGYHREAVASIASALERFYELYITTICLKHDVSREDYQSGWKNVATQSERQFGAYVFAYLIDHQGSQPPIIDAQKPKLDGVSKNKTKAWKEFRNSVIHKGYIPSASEVLAYGELVFSHINELIKDLKGRSDEFVGLAVRLNNFGLSRESSFVSNDGEAFSCTIHIPTILSLVKEPAESFEAALEQLKSYRDTQMHG